LCCRRAHAKCGGSPVHLLCVMDHATRLAVTPPLTCGDGVFQTDFITFPQRDRFTLSGTRESVPAPHAWLAYKGGKGIKKKRKRHTHTHTPKVIKLDFLQEDPPPSSFSPQIVFPRLSVPRSLLASARGERVNNEPFPFA